MKNNNKFGLTVKFQCFYGQIQSEIIHINTCQVEFGSRLLQKKLGGTKRSQTVPWVVELEKTNKSIASCYIHE